MPSAIVTFAYIATAQTAENIAKGLQNDMVYIGLQKHLVSLVKNMLLTAESVEETRDKVNNIVSLLEDPDKNIEELKKLCEK